MDIENAYITAPCTEKIWTILGPEFGSDAGKSAIVVHALYGLKNAGASFRNHLADCMTHLGFTPCLDDPDLWMRPEVHPSDGVSYYAYVLLYVDDISVVHHDAIDVLLRLDKYFKMKPGLIGDPDVYLGATIKQMRLANGIMAWASSPSIYVWASVDAVTKYLTNLGDRRWSMPKKAANPFPGDYEPELDTTLTLNPELSSWYASLIRMLQWMVNHGGIEIASQMASPRDGHLDALLHIFGFLRINHNSRMAYDPSNVFKPNNWKSFYGNVEESIPSNAPEPRGKDVDLRLYIDSDHAGEKHTPGTADRWAVWAVGIKSKLHHNVGKVALNGDRHHWLEVRTSGQDLNVNKKDFWVIATASCGGGNRAGGCGQRGYIRMIADNVTRTHGVEDLFLDALLPRLIEIKEISCPKILPLGVRSMAFLLVGLHAVDVLLLIFTHTWIICIHTNHHVLAIAKLRPRMRPATAKAAVDPLTFPPS